MSIESLKQTLKDIAMVYSKECCPKCEKFITTLDELIKEAGKEFNEL